MGNFGALRVQIGPIFLKMEEHFGNARHLELILFRVGLCIVKKLCCEGGIASFGVHHGGSSRHRVYNHAQPILVLGSSIIFRLLFILVSSNPHFGIYFCLRTFFAFLLNLFTFLFVLLYLSDVYRFARAVQNAKHEHLAFALTCHLVQLVLQIEQVFLLGVLVELDVRACLLLLLDGSSVAGIVNPQQHFFFTLFKSCNLLFQAVKFFCKIVVREVLPRFD